MSSVPGWTDDNRCQLCLDAVGIFSHRLTCRAIRPFDGWEPPPPECNNVLSGLQTCRSEFLSTRGLFTLKVRAPLPPEGGTFTWILSPPDLVPENAVWYIDGSLFDEPRRFARRTGFALVVTLVDGTLVGFGNGMPPRWIHDAAGAELWAFFIVTSLTAALPYVVTDCLGIVQGLRDGFEIACAPNRRLARTLDMISNALDHDAHSARARVRWMPSHGPVHSIVQAVDSNGHTVVDSAEVLASGVVGA